MTAAVLAALVGLGAAPAAAGGVPSGGAAPAASPAASSAETTTLPLDDLDESGLAEPEASAPADGAEAEAAGVAGAPVTLPDDVAESPDVDASVAAGEEADAERTIVALSEPLDTDGHDVHVVGVTWLAGPTDVTVDVRVRRGGEWSGWEVLPVDVAADDADGDVAGVRAGSDPFVVSGATEVQVRLLTESGEPPTDPRLVVVADDVTRADAAAAGAPGGPFGTAAGVLTAPRAPTPTDVDPATAVRTASGISAPRPEIRSRSSWGAAAPVGEMNIGQVLGATVHHTAGTNDYPMSQVPAILRGIQQFHTAGRGWSDIGYNFLVDRFGRIWEGRAGGVENTTAGVHASSFNSITTGISVMGNFETTTLSAEARAALVALIAWKLALHGVDAAGTLRTPAGKVFPAVVGHRDVPEAATACPGRNLYPLLPSIRAAAATRQVHERTYLSQDVNGDGVGDIVDLSGAGRAYLGSAPGSVNPFQARQAIGRNWNGMDLVVGSPTLIQGSGATDLVARERSTGRLHIYHGNGRGGFSGVTPWGRGWGGMSAVIAPGDWNGDGRADIIAIQRDSGRMYLYRGDGRGGTAPGVQIGRGWAGFVSVVSAGDVNGDGRRDLVALKSTGELLLYPGNGKGGFLTTRQLATGLTGYRDVIAPGDVTGDGRNDILLRPTTDGSLRLVRNKGGGTVALGPSWSTGWTTSTLMTGATGWNGAGTAVVISVDATTGTMYSARADAKARFTTGTSLGLRGDARQSVVVGDVTGTGAASVVSVTTGHDLYLSEARGDGTFAPPRQIGTRWQSIAQIAPAGDLDYDGVPDLLAVSTSGQLYLYPFASDGSGSLGQPVLIGHGFANHRVLGVGGWSTRTGADVLAIHKGTGQLQWFVGHGRNALTGGTVIGKGWQGMADVAAIGDASGAGNNDLVARDKKTGAYWIYFADGKGGFTGRQAVTGVPKKVG